MSWAVTFGEILQSGFFTDLSVLLSEVPLGLKLMYLILSHLSTLIDRDNIPKFFVNMKRTSSARKTAGESLKRRYGSPKMKGFLIINE